MASHQPPSKRMRTESSAGSPNAPDDRPLSITCLFCRSRKIKCDSKVPCSNCAKNGTGCVYTAKQKPGLKAGSGESMARRIEALEEQLRDQQDRLSQLEVWRQSGGPSAGGGVPSNEYSSMFGDGIKIEDHRSGSNMASYPEDNTNYQSMEQVSPAVHISPAGVLNSMGPPSVPYGNGNGSMQGEASTSGNVMQYGVGGVLPRDANGANLMMDYNNYLPNLPLRQAFEPPWQEGNILPRDDLVKDLIALFFERVAPWAMIVVQHPDEDDIAQYQSAPWSVLVHAMVVLSLRFSRDERLNACKEKVYEGAKKFVISEAIATTSVINLQALALIALDIIGSGLGPHQWGVIALLTRSAIHLDLPQEPESMSGSNATASRVTRTLIASPPASWKEDEARRRLFWLVYALDRLSCLSTGWDFGLQDFVVRRRLPCADRIWKGPDWYQGPMFSSPLHRDSNVPDPQTLSPATYVIEAFDFLSHTHILQSKPFDPMDVREKENRRSTTATLFAASRRWFSGLPPQVLALHAQEEEAPMNILTHALYHINVIKLQSPFAFPAVLDNGVVEPHASAAVESAKAICEIGKIATAKGNNPAIISPFLVWCCWVATRVLFMHACLSPCTLHGEFHILLEVLRVMAVDWTIAGDYARLLARAERKWRTTFAGESPSSAHHLSDAVTALLDFRRTAYSAQRLANNDATPAEPANPGGILNANGVYEPPWGAGAGFEELNNWFELPPDLFGSSAVGGANWFMGEDQGGSGGGGGGVGMSNLMGGMNT